MDKYFFKGVFTSSLKSNIESRLGSLLDNGNDKEEIVEVDWEDELVSALEELKKSGKKKKYYKNNW